MTTEKREKVGLFCCDLAAVCIVTGRTIKHTETCDVTKRLRDQCPHPQDQLADAGGGMVACAQCGKIVGRSE